MKHPFIKSIGDASRCMLCKRDVVSHGNKATCEACDAIDECEVFGKLDNPRAMLLCSACTQREIDNNSVLIAKHETDVLNIASIIVTDERGLPVLQNTTLLPNNVNNDVAIPQLSIIEKSQMIDKGMTYEKFFNAETVSIVAIKFEIDNDVSLGPNEKAHKLHELVLERIMSYKPAIVERQNEIHELVVKQQAGIRFLRDFGNEVRTNIREKLKEADATYTPNVVVKIPKITAPKKSPMEKLIEVYSLMHGVSASEAEEMIKKGRTS